MKEKGFKVRGKASTPSKFHSKEKRVTTWESKQANEINSNSKESKADSIGMAKEGQDRFFCVWSRKRVSKKRRKAQRKKNMERLIRIPETAKREASNRNDASEPEKSTTFFRQIHFPKSHEE